MKFGEFIKTRRIILRLTQAELSNFLHITPQCLSNYENDKTKIPLSIVLDLCYSLKISIDDFFNKNITNEEVTLDFNKYNIDNIHKNLAYYREKSKLTLKELSKKIKISIQRLSDFELDKTQPSIEEFIALCNCYNLNYEELFLVNNETNLIPNNYQKITKQNQKKYFYAGFAGFLGIVTVISLAITAGFFYSKSKEKKPLSVPNFSKILFRESLDENSSTDIFIKNREYYLFAYLDNSYNYPISSFKINDNFYQKDVFHEESTNKKVIIKFNSSILNLGENTFNVNGFTYINEKNKENYVTLTDINTRVDVLNDSIPSVNINNMTFSSTSIKGNLEITNDTYNLLKDKFISLTIKQNEEIIKEIKTKNEFSFTELKPKTSYTLIGSIKSNFYDEKGEIDHILFNKNVTTNSLGKIEQLTSTNDTISYNLELDEESELESIKLINKENNEIVEETNKKTGNFTNLLSNHQYILKISFKHLTKDYKDELIKSVHTKIVNNPIVKLEEINISETKIEIKPHIYYDLTNFHFNYIELKSVNNSIAIKEDRVQDSYIFDNLFSNTFYNVDYNYSYDLKDGAGIQTKTSSTRVETLIYQAPRVFFDAVSPDANSIYFKIAKEEFKIPATYIKTELYKGSTLTETTTLEEGKFRELETNYKYTLKLYYSYDLLDGNGTVVDYFEASVTTSTGIIVEEI